MSENPLAALLTPLALRGLVLPNRVAMAPMTRFHSSGGIPGADVASYYARRAASGIGLVVTEGIAVPHLAAVDHPDVPRLDGDAALAGWRAVVAAVHDAGGRIVPQLWHQGPLWQPEEGHGAALRPSGLWGPPDGMISLPEETRSRGLPPVRPMSDEQIADAVAAFARAARNARAIGFDGIAIHGAHGYLIDSFLWGETNRRDDRWGRERAAFAVAVIRAVRAEVGHDLPIIFRFSQFKMQDYRAQLADSPAELAGLLEPLAEAGVDLFDASQRYFDTPAFAGSPLNLAGWAKRITGVPAMTVGGVALGKSAGASRHIDDSQNSVNNLPLLLERFERGEFDMVAVGRAILNDPQWFVRACRGEAFLAFDPANLERLT